MTGKRATRGFEESQSQYMAESASDLIGQVRRFGPHGPAYEVLGMHGEGDISIVVIESGERLDYPMSDFLADPVAVAVP